MSWIIRLFIAVTTMTVFVRAVHAQDLYDPAVLRTFALQFHDANWESRLHANYESETLILADLTVEGVTYPSVGVRIRGNSSYFFLPSGSQKFSLKIETDFVDPNQQLMGYDSINLNNGFQDPTFTREVVYNNFVGQFIPNIRANNAVVTLNGQNWGVYINVQQGNKSMLRRYFANPDGVRMTCSNNPTGPGLAYAGTNVASYRDYEVNNDGGYADPITSVLIPVTRLLSNTTAANIRDTDARFAIDPSIWSVVLENILTDEDSYLNKGCDFATYTDPLDNRMHLLQRDGNESFKADWQPTRSFALARLPLLSRIVNAVPEMRQRYFAHYRTVMRQLDWATMGAMFEAHRGLIEEAVRADPKRLYSLQNFEDGFGSATVSLRMSNGSLPPSNESFGYGNIIGLRQFFNQRAVTLGNSPELIAAGPTVLALAASSDTPVAGEPVWVTAVVAPAVGASISKVELFYRANPTIPYESVEMMDDGLSADGAAGDGVYGVVLPVADTGGQRVS